MNKSGKIQQLFVIALAVLALLQLVPYGRDRSVPPDGIQVALDSPRTEELTRRACYNCHSNRTQWPWYAGIAPVSWRIQNHVQEGREALNFTALDTTSESGAEAAGEAGETVQEGEMPPFDYAMMHHEARLNATEKADLIRGLNATFATFVEKKDREAHRAR